MAATSLQTRRDDPQSTETWWATVAAYQLHWYHPGSHAWVSRDSQSWRGWSASDASPVELTERWQPWLTILDASEAPFNRWFHGARTNAAFNELDRHVLGGGGERAALLHEPAPEEGVGSGGGSSGGSTVGSMELRTLFLESVFLAHALQHQLGMRDGERLALLLPTSPAGASTLTLTLTLTAPAANRHVPSP